MNTNLGMDTSNWSARHFVPTIAHAICRLHWQRFGVAFAVVLLSGVPGWSQTATYETDPTTGDIYAKSVRTVQRTVVDTVMVPQEQTYYRPETTTETVPEVQTLYLPVTETKWRPYTTGRWNPFRQPTVSYRPVNETRWERRNQVINRVTSTTRYVPEKRTIQVATQVPKTQTQQIVSYQKVSNGVSNPAIDTRIEGISTAVASRLKPISTNQLASQRLNGAAPSQQSFPRTIASAMPPAMRVATTSVGRMTSDPPRRSVSQSGLRGKRLGSVPSWNWTAATPSQHGFWHCKPAWESLAIAAIRTLHWPLNGIGPGA